MSTLARIQERAAPSRLGWYGLMAAGLIVLGLWLYSTPAGLLGKADAIGYAVCHRIELRSLHLGERALPLCSRCSGMYLGAMLGLVYFHVRGRGRSGVFPPLKIAVVLALFGAAFAVDGVNSLFHLIPSAPHLYEPTNFLRLVTGTSVGLGLAALMVPAFNQNAWVKWRGEPVIGSFSDFGLLLVLAGLLVASVWSENPLILYPLAIVSSLGVVSLLTSVYSVFYLLLRRKENQAQSWREVVPAVAAGALIAMTHLALFDLGRFWLTGTWSGFSL